VLNLAKFFALPCPNFTLGSLTLASINSSCYSVAHLPQCSSSVPGSLPLEGFFVLVRTSVKSGVLVVPALTQVVCSGRMIHGQQDTVHTVASPASPTASVPAAPSSSASLSLISKRAQKGKKNPPGSRNQQKKAHKAAVASAASPPLVLLTCRPNWTKLYPPANQLARTLVVLLPKPGSGSKNIRSWRTKHLATVSNPPVHACSRFRGSRIFALLLL